MLCGHLALIWKTIKVMRARHAGHRWRTRGKLISNVFQWTLSHTHTCVSQPEIIYTHLLCMDTGCRLKELIREITCKDGWWEGVLEPMLSARIYDTLIHTLTQTYMSVGVIESLWRGGLIERQRDREWEEVRRETYRQREGDRET